MEILQLRYFFETAQSEKIARTAEKYGVPASSVSASIKRLEKELNTTLFDRQSNTLRVNENGKKLMRSVGSLLNELDKVSADFANDTPMDTKLRILVRTLRNAVMDSIIAYRRSNPHVCFVTSFGMDEQDVRDYDLIVDVQTDRYGNCRRTELTSLRVLVKAAPNHPLVGKKLEMSQLRNESFVTMGEGTNLHELLIKACKNAGFAPKIVVETNDDRCYGKCIREGVGIGLSKESKVSNSAVSVLDVTDFLERQSFYCYYPETEMSPAALEFAAFLRQYIQEHI